MTVEDNAQLDPVDFNVISQIMMSIPHEMSVNMFRAAYSNIVRDVKDASVVVMDRQGNIVAQAENIPIHLNSVKGAFDGCASVIDMTSLEESEIVVHNDPFLGGQHLPDVFIFTPIRCDGELIGFCGSVAHHADIGGGGPGSTNPNATDIFGEGLVISAVRMRLEQDFRTTFLGQMVSKNVRIPHETLGDFNAQLTANETGVRRMVALAGKFGVGRVKAVMEQLISYSETRTRSAIRNLPNGTWYSEQSVDSDGVSDRPYKVCVSIKIEDDSIYVDLAGTDETAKGIINAPIAATYSAVYVALKNLLTDADVPPNEGCNRPISIHVPEDTVLNPKFPAPTRARINVCQRLVDAIMLAFAQIDPDRAVAICHNTTLSVRLSYLSSQGWATFADPLRGGFGGNSKGDGACQCGAITDNCPNTSVESAEKDYDFFRIKKYCLLPDTMGYGKFNGSPSAVREFEILKDDVVLTSFSDRHKSAPLGILGGRDGMPNKYSVMRDGEEIVLPSKVWYDLKKGDLFQVYIGSAAGYGDPRERDPIHVTRDVKEMRLSVEQARNVFNVEVTL